MTETEVIIKKCPSGFFFGAEIFVDGTFIGAAAVTDILIKELGEHTVCCSLRRRIGGREHTVMHLRDVRLDIAEDADIPVHRKECA